MKEISMAKFMELINALQFWNKKKITHKLEIVLDSNNNIITTSIHEI